jgi:hypothetical protein
MKAKIFFLLILLMVGKSLEANTVKISFLDNQDAIDQTVNFLLSKGYNQKAVNSFRKAIEWYNSSPKDLDLKKFPQLENGFYSFDSVSNLVGAFSHPLIFTRHRNELNCFDTVILLAGDLIQIKAQPDDMIGPLLAPATTTNHVVLPRAAATPRDAFAEIYPLWLGNSSGDIFDDTSKDKRISLIAALDSYYFLPNSTTRQNFGGRLLQSIRLSRQRFGVKFPKNVEVVICYNAFIDPQKVASAVSSHVGLLFQDKTHYVFIEKLGVTAPYVRLDFTDKKDLLVWLRAEIEPIKDKHEFLLASFDDREIDDLDEDGN